MLLAIDTATRMAGLALYDEVNGCIRTEESWYSANNHTIELMPRLVQMMDQQQLSPTRLTGLAVSLGPGSFTGLRIGLAVAKGLAAALSIPMVGVPTLDVVARPHQNQNLPIWAVVQAGRGRICAARYKAQRGQWHLDESYQLTTLAALCDKEKEPVLVCGELEDKERHYLRERFGLSVVIASPAFSLRRPAHLAEMAWERLERGQSDNAASLAPIYLKNP